MIAQSGPAAIQALARITRTSTCACLAGQAAGFHIRLPEARNPAWVALDFLNVESMIAGGVVPGTTRKVPLKAEMILAPGTARCESLFSDSPRQGISAGE